MPANPHGPLHRERFVNLAETKRRTPEEMASAENAPVEKLVEIDADHGAETEQPPANEPRKESDVE